MILIISVLHRFIKGVLFHIFNSIFIVIQRKVSYISLLNELYFVLQNEMIGRAVLWTKRRMEANRPSTQNCLHPQENSLQTSVTDNSVKKIGTYNSAPISVTENSLSTSVTDNSAPITVTDNSAPTIGTYNFPLTTESDKNPLSTHTYNNPLTTETDRKPRSTKRRNTTEVTEMFPMLWTRTVLLSNRKLLRNRR